VVDDVSHWLKNGGVSRGSGREGLKSVASNRSVGESVEELI
jgi:hypothetical protein